MSQNRLVSAFWEVFKAPWLPSSLRSRIDYAYFSDFVQQWRSPISGGSNVLGTGVDSSGNLTWGGGAAVQPLWQSAVYTFAANAGLADQPFFIANQTYTVKKIVEIHATAGTVAGVTCVVKKVASGQTVANGTALQSTTFALDGTANTLQTATVVTNPATITLAVGDRLAVDFTGTLTTLAGVCITVFMAPTGSAVPTVDVTYAVNANATLADTQFFVANDRYTILSARYCATAQGSSTPVVQLTKDTSTNTPGAGTDLLANTSNTGFACGTGGTANVPQVASFKTTAGLLTMATGDRLSVDYAGTLTALAGVVITVSLQPIQATRTEVTYFFTGASVNTDQVFFIADRDYTVRISSGVWSAAAGGTSTVEVVKDAGTDIPGGGTDLLLSAFNLNATAQTVVVDLMAAAPYTVHLKAGDRLSADFANAVQSSTDVCITVGLNAI